MARQVFDAHKGDHGSSYGLTLERTLDGEPQLTCSWWEAQAQTAVLYDIVKHDAVSRLSRTLRWPPAYVGLP